MSKQAVLVTVLCVAAGVSVLGPVSGQVADWQAGQVRLGADDAASFDYLGTSVAASAQYLVAGAPGVDSGAGAVYVYRINRQAGRLEQTAVLTAEDAQEDDEFGSSVAIDGATIVVGAYGESGGPGNPWPQTGAVYVFELDRATDSWLQVAKLTSDGHEPRDNDNFGQSVAISQDIIVVGSFSAGDGDGNGWPDAGVAYVFARRNNAWNQVARLAPSDQASSVRAFGQTVAVSTNASMIAVTAGDVHPEPGAVYLYRRDGVVDAWDQVAKLSASDETLFDSFGQALAFNNGSEAILIGASGEDGGPGDPLTDQGCVYLFQYDATSENWTETEQIWPTDGMAYDNFGSSVAFAHAGGLVVGASGSNSFAGAVHVLQRGAGGGAWYPEARLDIADASPGDQLGVAVAVTPDASLVIAGADSEDAGENDPIESAGSVFVYAPDACAADHAANSYTGTCDACPDTAVSVLGWPCACPAGDYHDPGTNACLACVGTGAHGACLCPAGRFNDGTSCAACPAGSDVKGSPAGATSSDQCVACAAGTYATDDGCVACAGLTTSETGATGCHLSGGGIALVVVAVPSVIGAAFAGFYMYRRRISPYPGYSKA